MTNNEAPQPSRDFIRELSEQLVARCAVTYGQVSEALQDYSDLPQITEQYTPKEYAEKLIKWLNLMEIKVTSPLSRGDTRQFNDSRLALVGLVRNNARWNLGVDGMVYAATPDGLLRLDVCNERTPKGLKWGYRVSSGPVEKLQPAATDPLGRVHSPKSPFVPIAEDDDLTAVIKKAIEVRRAPKPTELFSM